jgi:pimeloyl-ACP methyl ester carboxylesterase
MGAQRGLLLAVGHPERVEAAVFVGGNYLGGGEPLPERMVCSWEEAVDTDEGWAKHSRHYWLRDYRGYLEAFASRMLTEPHSTKPIEDTVGWGLGTTAQTLALTYWAPFMEPDEARELAGRVRCPVLVIHGDQDAVGSVTRGIALAEDTGGRLVLLGAPVTHPTSATRSGSTCSCATSSGGAAHDRHTETARADARPLPRRRGLRRARRRSGLLRGLR